MDLKATIHHLVDDCNDEAVLYNALETLQHPLPTIDWWQELPEAQKKKTFASLEQSNQGHTVSHEEVMEKVWAKFTK
ncbi:MAG: hypothetical protein V4722_05270 [Bacteroidota bacterium]